VDSRIARKSTDSEATDLGNLPERSGVRRLTFFAVASVVGLVLSGCYRECKGQEGNSASNTNVRSQTVGRPRCSVDPDEWDMEGDTGATSGDDDSGTSGDGPDLGGGTG
jgi:hypothetical protein